MGSSTDMPCREFVELVTAYLDGALSSADRERCDAHWRNCPECRAYLAQMQLVVGSLGQLRRREVEENGAERDRLLDLFRTRGLHNRESRERSVPLGMAGEFAAPGDHISYFWESEHEFDAAAGFLAAGVERDEGCVLLGHDAANARLLAGLERRGLAPDELRRRDRLHTVSGEQPADAVLGAIGDRIRTAVDRGVPMVRVLGNLGWEHPGWPAEADILRLEARVTDAVRNLASVVMCAYDVRGLSGRSLLLGGLECHPLTLRRAALRHNEHHVPAAQFLETLALDAA
ncbi:MAG TPA: MEDS domain-containing protein [Candidatus Methylomirabilis sp.]|nr:MEDS domain-containing protein [Candidatus Methylomirabilis sp.]